MKRTDPVHTEPRGVPHHPDRATAGDTLLTGHALGILGRPADAGPWTPPLAATHTAPATRDGA